MEATTIKTKSLITPQDQTLREVFGQQRAYFIDIYQREYKWTDENVKQLLDDVALRFDRYQRTKSAPKEIQQDVMERFEPYFLNTYLTAIEGSNTAIVDGQQRLTTLLLILIKLHGILREVEKDAASKGRTFGSGKLSELIYESNDFDGAERFKIFNENRDPAFRALVEGTDSPRSDQTSTRIAENYIIISKYFDAFLAGGTAGQWDLVKLTYYLTYLLDRVSIVEIRIERQENVAMIFEVVNDRGLGLKPYEILKGKLIGGLPTKQKEKANAVWTDLQEQYFEGVVKNGDGTALDLDAFFQAFFRAKFANSEKEYESFEGDYHYEIYRNKAVRDYFGDFQDKDLLFERITKDIKYFAELYLELRTSYAYEPVIFNKLLDQNQQYLLILSAIRLNDPDRIAKITGVAAKFDQFHTVLKLLDAYESNAFQRLVYPLNKDIREQSMAAIVPLFDRALIGSLEEDGLVTEGSCTTAKDIFDFERFKAVRNQWTNFSKYVLTRIDRYWAQLLDKPSFASEHLEELETRFNKNNKKVHAMHLEHILTQHKRNRALFTNAEGVFDEVGFTRTRNMLGMVLLLKDKQNLSSNDDVYADKVKDYRTSNLIWNELLVGHGASIDAKRIPEDLRVTPVEPERKVFPLAAVEDRQRAVYNMIKAIWGGL